MKNTEDFVEQTNRLITKRGNTNRVLIYCKWEIPTREQEEAPNNKNTNMMAKGLIKAFNIANDNRKQKGVNITIISPVKGVVVMGGTEYVLGFIGLSQKPQGDNSIEVTTKIRHLLELDNILFQVSTIKNYN